MRSEECYYHWGRLRRNRGEARAHARAPAGCEALTHLTPPPSEALALCNLRVPSEHWLCLSHPCTVPEGGDLPQACNSVTACGTVAQILSESSSLTGWARSLPGALNIIALSLASGWGLGDPVYVLLSCRWLCGLSGCQGKSCCVPLPALGHCTGIEGCS